MRLHLQLSELIWNEWAMKKSALYVVSSLMMFELAACGYKGPLYMPIKPAASAPMRVNASAAKVDASNTKVNTSSAKINVKN